MKLLFFISLLCLSFTQTYAQERIDTLEQTKEDFDNLKIAFHQSPPFLVEQNDVLVGPSAWMWKQIQNDIGLQNAPKQYSFEDLLSALENEEIDICISPLSITSKRMKKFDFSVPFFTTHTTLLKRSESGLQKMWSFLGSFFSLDFFKVLFALALVILIFGFAVWFFERKRNTEEFGRGVKGLWSGFWWSAVTMTTVGYGDKSPKTLGGRIVALFWMFTAIIIISGFTASIASSLTVNEMGQNISSTEDLKDIKLATVSNSGTAKWFQDNFFTNVQYFLNLEEAVLALEKEEIDYIAYDLPLLQDILNQDRNNLFALVDFKFNSQFYAMAFNKDIPNSLKEEISLQITKATEGLEWKLLLNEYNLIKE